MATDLERLVVQLSADIKSYERAMARAQGVTNREFNAIERRARLLNTNLNGIALRTAQSFVAPLAGIGAALGTQQIAAYADEWTVAGNKVAAAAQITETAAVDLNKLKDAANDARADFTGYVDLYAKILRSAAGVAETQEDIATATAVVAKAFKAGGAAASEQAAGILQLGQALGSGTLQGDELRSIRENAPLLANAIAKEFDTTIAELKELGAEGKLVTDRVFKAILSAQEPIEAAFASTNATIRDAITEVNNEFLAYIGNADESAGASARLVEALQTLADNFEGVADTVVTFATLLIGALTGRALVGVVAGLGNAVVALGAFLTAIRAGTAATITFRAALGPIGLIAGAAAAAVLLLGDNFGAAESAADSFKTAIDDNETALANARSSSEGFSAALRDQIAMQLEAAKAALTEADAQAKAAIARRDAFRAATGLEFAPLEYSADSAAVNADAIAAAVLQLDKQLSEIDARGVTPSSDGFGNGNGSGSGSSGGKSKQNAFEREIQQIRERTAGIQAETEAMSGINPLIDDYGYALEHARAKHELLTAAEREGIAITPELTATIEALAAGYAGASAEANRLADSQDEARQRAEEFRNLRKDALGGFISDLKEGVSVTEALSNALAKVSDRLLDIAINSAFDGGGGFLSGIFGGGGRGLNFFPAAPAPPGIGLYDDGGFTGPGAKMTPKGLVHAGEYVFSKEAVDKAGAGNLETLHRSLKGYADGGLVAPSMPRLPPNRPSGAAGLAGLLRILVSAEEGPMLRPLIRAESKNIAVKVSTANNKRRAAAYQGGGKPHA